MKKQIFKADTKTQAVMVLGGITVPCPADAIRIIVDGQDVTELFGIQSELEIYFEAKPIGNSQR